MQVDYKKMLTASSDLKVTSFLLSILGLKSSILMVSTRKNGGFSVANYVSLPGIFSVAIAVLLAYQVP